jgi:GntR family transcriptional regulator, transcriptional repressor for pyruvate dehydrogenase complex
MTVPNPVPTRRTSVAQRTIRSPERLEAGGVWSSVRPAPMRVPDAVAAVLEDMIQSGQLKPGERLPSERDLANHLAVSRNTVREALARLGDRGLVSRTGHARASVSTQHHSPLTGPILDALSEKVRSVIEILDLRESLEPAIAAKAAERATAEDIAKLRGLAVEIGRERSIERLAELDRHFHLAVAEATNNHLHVGFVSRAMELVRADREHSTGVIATEADGEPRNHWHLEILAAIEHRDPVRAHDGMIRHIRKVSSLVAGIQASRAALAAPRSNEGQA